MENQNKTIYTIKRMSENELKIDITNTNIIKKRSLEDLLNEIGIGYFQYRLLVLCGLAFMADSMEVSLLGYLSTCAFLGSSAFELDDAKRASISGIVFAGQLFGSLLWGKVGDRFGRRKSFLVSSFIVSIFGIGSGLSPNYWSLLLLRMLVGVGIGGTPIPFDIIAEFMPLSHRGLFLVFIEYFWAFGSMMVAGLAWILLPSSSWRILTIVTALPVAISFIFSSFFLPESVRWLISRKKTEEAEIIIKYIATTNGVKLEPFKLSYDLEFSSGDQTSSWIDLVSTKYMRQRTIPLWIIWGAFAFAYNGTVLYVNKVYSSTSSSICSYNYKYIFINSTSETVGLIVTNVLIEYLGRARIQTILYFCSSLVYIIIGSVGSSNKTGLFAALYFGRLLLMGSSSATWCITPELYPTRLRTTGHSICNSTARLFAFACPYLVYSSASNTDVSICFAVLASISGFASLTLPETKEKKLDQDDNDFMILSKGSISNPLITN